VATSLAPGDNLDPDELKAPSTNLRVLKAIVFKAIEAEEDVG